MNAGDNYNRPKVLLFINLDRKRTGTITAVKQINLLPNYGESHKLSKILSKMR